MTRDLWPGLENNCERDVCVRRPLVSNMEVRHDSLRTQKMTAELRTSDKRKEAVE